MMKTKILLAKLLLVIVLLFVAACGAQDASAPAGAPAQAEEVQPAESTEETSAASEEIAVEPTEPPAQEAASEPTVAPDEEEAAADLGPPPAFTEELKASNPEDFVITSGGPQLVEFFAFW
jgi:hypothetical protein